MTHELAIWFLWGKAENRSCTAPRTLDCRATSLVPGSWTFGQMVVDT
jgi:hypothetical protein